MIRMDQLTLCELIRFQLADSSLTFDNFDDIANNTNIFTTVSNIFQLADDNFVDGGLTDKLKSKALNICVNMAMASESQINAMLEPKYGIFA